MDLTKPQSQLQHIPSPPPPKPIQEDAYVQKLGQIIQRDFFPDLPNLRNTHGIPMTDTPVGIRGDTHPATQTAIQENLGLDAFQSRFTSQDNASFGEILEKQNSDQRARLAWAHQNQEMSSGNTLKLETWKFNPQNALMYGPQGAPLTLQDVSGSRAEPKAISHSATRFEMPDPISTASTRQGTHSTPFQMHQSGYGFVPSTPSLIPNQDVDPAQLMTWGTIESTPLLVSNSGPSFSMPPTPKRELVAQRLSDRASKSLAKRTRLESPASRILSPAAQKLLAKTVVRTPIFQSPLHSQTPLVRLTPKSIPNEQSVTDDLLNI